MRRIVLIVAVVLAVPLAFKVVPTALAAARGPETSGTALVPESAPPAPETTAPEPASSKIAAPKTTASKTAPPVLAAPRLRAKKAAPHRPKQAKVLSSGACEASFYGEGQATASGEAFNPGALTAAHRSLPFGARVRVINKNNAASVVVRINDRGPFSPGRCLDLSTAAMRAVGGISSGVIPVRYEVLAA
ncbi:hypothetical protein GCM10027589_58450 [Actinocorallia lasiicapitis]